MAHPTKIATCCYCGARSFLQPTARQGHELACGSCGAPLHDMKWLKTPAKPAPAPAAHRPAPKTRPVKPSKPAKPAKVKRRKPLWQKAFEEVWDTVEDIFD